LAFM